MSKTQPARGMRDFLPADLRRREYVIRVIKETYERYGFEPLETPAVENIETLLGKYGEEGNQLIYKILKRGEHEQTGQADLALRYDLTVPLARVVAEYGASLPKFFKRYQIQPVWRADRPARGRYREFYQCDVDCIGTRSPVVEAELCAAASDALTALGFNNFTIRLNHRQVLAGVLEAAGIAPEKHGEALVAIDKLDKVGREGVAKEFAARGIVAESGEELLGFFENLPALEHAAEFVAGDGRAGETSKAEAYNRAALGRLVEFVGDHEAGARGIDNLRRIVEYASAYGAADKIKIDPSLARGLSYYTGAILEISVPDLAGSLGGGGRYDNLVGMFSGREVPACGFALGLERIVLVMTERGMFPEDLERAAADVLVTIWDEDSARDSLAFAAGLRRDAPTLRVDVYPEADKLGKQLKYASSRGVGFVAVLGEEERASGMVTLKNMKTGEQQRIRREQASSIISDIAGGDQPNLALHLNEFGAITTNWDNALEAIRFYQQGLEIAESVGNKRGVSTALHHLGALYLRQGELAKARQLFSEGLKVSEELGLRSDTAINLLELSRLAKEQGDETGSTEFLQAALKIYEELKGFH